MAEPTAELTEAEAQLYDRQLRVWGVETQKRLSAASVLIVGCTGLAAEVAKNIVLAGVGSITLVDDAPASQRAPGNFLIHADVESATSVAEACVDTLREMNPLVKVSWLPGAPATFAGSADLAGFNVMLLSGQPAHVVDAADAACAAAGVALYAALSRGAFGWVFANLQEHSFVVESKVDNPDGSVKKVAEERALSFVPWKQAIAASAAGRSPKRISPLFLVLRVCMQLEMEQRRGVAAADSAALHAARTALCTAEGLDDGAVHLQALEAYAASSEEMPAISAIVGGVVANDLLKAVAGKGEPLVNNLFLYSLVDGTGAEKMGKMPIRLKEVVYTLSSFEQGVMGGLWKDLPHKMAHYLDTAKNAVVYCGIPLGSVVYYCQSTVEKEKLHHRY